MPEGESGGFFLSLLTESFAVRAFVGSLAAAALAALAVRAGVVRSSRGRRLLVLAPVLTAAGAGLASVRGAEAYLPQLERVATTAHAGAAGQVLDLLGDLRTVTTTHGLDLLLLSYGVVVGALILRRLIGLHTACRLLARATAPSGHGYLVPLLNALALRMRVAPPRLVLLDRCPGGAFTFGTRRPVIALDPALLAHLDARELEGLLAHELAHVKRGDTAVSWLVGVFRDLTFFLPPVHLAGRWLAHEQEEGADELASFHTGRPAALASSILKVWDSSRGRRQLRAACAAIGFPARRVALSGGGTDAPSLSGAARAICIRVERLIARAPAVSRRRRDAEVALAASIVAAACAVALAFPAWIASDLNADALSFGYLAPVPPVPVESAAFSTFRALTATAGGETGTGPERASRQEVACPCVESRADLRQGIPATGVQASSHLLWAASQDPWEVTNLREQAAARARPLWTLSDSGPQVGFFVVARGTEEARW